MSVNLYNVGIEEWYQILALFVGCHKYHIIHWLKVPSVHPSQYSDLIIKNINTFVCHAAGGNKGWIKCKYKYFVQ